MGIRKRPRGAFASVALTALVVVAVGGVSTPSLANPSPAPQISTGTASQPDFVIKVASESDPTTRSNPNARDLTPDEVAALKKKALATPPSEADLARTADLERRIAAAKTSAADVAAGPGPYSPACKVSDATPSRATFQGVDTWRLINGTTLWGTIGGVNIQNYCAIGKSFLIQQADGNLVLYDENYQARWHMNTWRNPGGFSRVVDGSIYTYDGNGHLVRWIEPTGLPSYNLHVQADGNLVMYKPVWVKSWATNTNH